MVNFVTQVDMNTQLSAKYECRTKEGIEVLLVKGKAKVVQNGGHTGKFE